MNQQNQNSYPQKGHDLGLEITYMFQQLSTRQNSKCAIIVNTEHQKGKEEERLILTEWNQGSLDRDGYSL